MDFQWHRVAVHISGLVLIKGENAAQKLSLSLLGSLWGRYYSRDALIMTHSMPIFMLNVKFCRFSEVCASKRENILHRYKYFHTIILRLQDDELKLLH